MSDFRFRATAALDLRRRQESDAATTLARAEAHLRAAEQQATDAEASRRTAQQHLATVEQHGSDAATLSWHRNWIVRLSNELTECRSQVQTRARTVREAEQRWRLARQRRLALERMYERALRRHTEHQRLEELKVIDELARLRYVIADEWRDDT